MSSSSAVGDRIRFAYAYGEKEVVVPVPEPRREEGRTVYRAETEAHTLTVTPPTTT